MKRDIVIDIGAWVVVIVGLALVIVVTFTHESGPSWISEFVVLTAMLFFLGATMRVADLIARWWLGDTKDQS